METYGKILIIAMPLFLLLVLFEKWYGWRKGNDTVRTMDMISSLSSGVTNSTKDVLGLSIAIISYSWMVENLTIYQVQSSWLLYVIAFLALDFAGYWVHRLAHTVNFFWNNHIVHHSSEEFNLACALRQYHTQHINKMGWLEYIIVTPAHHRVHHAINPEYLDKNYGQIFIFWDRMFGTFQEESPAIPAVYGVTRPVRTWNPIKINFMHLWLLMQDAWHTQSWKDKLRVWLMPLGWRPADVVEKYPVYKIEDVYHFEKYDTPAPKGMIIYLWIQLFCLLLIVSYLFGNVASIGLTNMMYYGLFIFAQVYALTEFMDRNPRALIYEVVKNMICVGGILYYGGWFGLQNYFGASSYILMGYFFVSTAIVAAYTSQLTRPLNHSRTLS